MHLLEHLWIRLFVTIVLLSVSLLFELTITEKQKEENKQLSSLRIFVEHTIRIIKIFRVAQERFRLKPEKYKSVIYTVCGLVRLRIGALILEIVENCDRIEECIIIQRHLWSDFLVEEPANPSRTRT